MLGDKSEWYSNVLLYRSWLIYRWKCWSQHWWGHSWCCMWLTLTLRMMMTALQSYSASQEVLRDDRSDCCPLFVHIGIRHSLAGRNVRPVSGSSSRLRRWLNVSVDTYYASVPE